MFCKSPITTMENAKYRRLIRHFRSVTRSRTNTGTYAETGERPAAHLRRLLSFPLRFIGAEFDIPRNSLRICARKTVGANEAVSCKVLYGIVLSFAAQVAFYE